jgi:hypothetical protein
MPLRKFVVTLDPSVGISSIPTYAAGIVRGPTVTVKGMADCVKETFDSEHLRMIPGRSPRLGAIPSWRFAWARSGRS